MIPSDLQVNVLVAVGSVDGMAGAAAYIRHLNNPDIKLIFTQAFQVNRIDVSKWLSESRVGFIDLAVNTRNSQMTVDFVKKIYDCGHKILFIADEHGKEAWQSVLKECGHDTSELVIKPKDRKKYGSSCAILKEKFGESADVHTKALLRDGHAGDQMNFDTPLGRVFNNGVKSNMSDPERRPYLAKYMAYHDTPDIKIQGWMDEYAEMEANLPKILESAKDLGDGIFSYDCTIGSHDATALFKCAYETSPIVVLSGTNVFIEGKNQVGASIATNRKDLNVLKIIQSAGIKAGGMSAKANFARKDLKAAINAVREAHEAQ